MQAMKTPVAVRLKITRDSKLKSYALISLQTRVIVIQEWNGCVKTIAMVP